MEISMAKVKDVKDQVNQLKDGDRNFNLEEILVHPEK